jgi:hypothetical protein
MSRGPGKWQRVILTRLQDEEGFLLFNCLYAHLDRVPRHAEYSAMYRAAVLLAKQGSCFVSRVWARNVADRRTACVWVCRPGVSIEGEVWTRYEVHGLPVDPWADLTIPLRL